MPFINMDRRLKISKILIDNYIFILLMLAVVTHKGSNAFGYDSAASCSPNGKLSRRGRAQLLAAIPCDLARQPYCNLPGAAYPWHAVRRFVHENQGLMKRMYGDMRHISVLRDEIKNNDIDIEDIEMAAERYSRKTFRRSSKFMHQHNDGEFTYGGNGGSLKNNDIIKEPHFRPVATTTSTTVRPTSNAALPTNTNQTPTVTDAKPISMTNDESKSPKASATATTNNDIKDNLNSKSSEVDKDVNDDQNLASNSVYELPTLASNEFGAQLPIATNNGDNIEIIDSPQLNIELKNYSAPIISATLKASNTKTITTTPSTATTKRMTAPATSTIPASTTTKRTTTSTSDMYHRRRPQYPYRQRPRPQQQQQKVFLTTTTASPQPANDSELMSSTLAQSKISIENSLLTSTASTLASKIAANSTFSKDSSTDSNHKITPTSSTHSSTPFFEKLRRQPVTPTSRPGPTTSAAPNIPTSRPPVLRDGQLFQDTVKQEPAPVVNLRGVNACPVKEEVVAPFWANNTRGEVLALLNLYPFEQYVHWEKCTHEHKQMFCRDGCRCEQQYRLHRLLAYDPRNECRGIFSDWFRFPSCCICKCYNVPMEFRATSRSPRRMQSFPEDQIDDQFAAPQDDSDTKHPLEKAEAEVKNAIYEHATEDWYRPRDFDETYDEDMGDWEM